jgi:hypothetical protein
VSHKKLDDIFEGNEISLQEASELHSSDVFRGQNPRDPRNADLEGQMYTLLTSTNKIH